MRPGQPIEAVLDAYKDWRIPAHVITTVPSADRQKATMKVRIGFDKLDPRILPDMGVKVSFLTEKAPVETARRRARGCSCPRRRCDRRTGVMSCSSSTTTGWNAGR